MSYQERRALVALFSSLIITVLYSLVMFPKYPSGDAYSPEIFRFWGSFFLVLILVSIVIRIIVAIAFVIIHTIITREVEADITDERDRLIDFKGTRNSMLVFILGFVLAMAALAAGATPTVMFLMLFLSGAVADIVGELSNFIYYRRGV